jgi:hypothetical protein
MDNGIHSTFNCLNESRVTVDTCDPIVLGFEHLFHIKCLEREGFAPSKLRSHSSRVSLYLAQFSGVLCGQSALMIQEFGRFSLLLLLALHRPVHHYQLSYCSQRTIDYHSESHPIHRQELRRHLLLHLLLVSPDESDIL